MIQKHFVTFLSPGTFLSEETTKPISGWNVDEALGMVSSVHERYGATPYGFYFTTRTRGPDDLDSKQSARSVMYYLGGEVETYDQVVARNDPKDETLLWNMRTNGYDRIITNRNSWKFTAALKADDVVLERTK